MPRTKGFDEQEALNKAMEIFWKQGYHATSMQNLVDYMGISRASLYDTYGSKKELFERTFQQYRNINTGRLINFLNSSEDIKEGFRKLFENAIREYSNDPEYKGCFVVNTSTEFIPEFMDLKESLRQNKEVMVQVFQDYLYKGVQAGQIAADKDLKAIANLLFTLQNGLQVITGIPGEEKALREVVNQALSVLD